MERRFTPLALALGLAVAALLARLWDIQVLQHDIWARESANLVRAFEIDPYVRGTIRDRKGRPIVRDEEVYALEFVWREFRRGHPLGQVTMLRSLAAMRPVGIDETRLDLREAALAYASMTPDELEAFARGEALDLGLDYVPAVPALDAGARRERARQDRRRSRANDMAYYLHRLLGLSRGEVKVLQRLVRDVEGAGARSFMDLAGEVTDQSTDDIASALAERVLAADERLTRLAALIDWPEPEPEDPSRRRGAWAPSASEADLVQLSPGDRLVELVEEQRRSVADESADALFTIAAGFSPTRLSAENLGKLDLEWLRVALDWDSVRLDDWIVSRGSGFEREARAWLAGHTIARSKINGGDPADSVISAVAHAFRTDPEGWARENAAPQNWRQVDELVAVADLPVRLARGERIERAASEVRLPFQEPVLRTAPREGAALVAAVLADPLERAAAEINAARLRDARAGDGGGRAPRPATAGALARVFVEAAGLDKRTWSAKVEEPMGDVLVALHDALQVRVAELLDLARGDDGEPLAFAGAALEKAQETRAYVLRDRGGRSRVVGGPPGIDLVLLVSRYQTEFAGFRVTTRTERTPVALGPDGESPVAKHLIGTVRSPFLVEVFRLRPQMEELGALQRKLVLPDEDRGRILSLVDEAYRAGELIGGGGLEAWFDTELAGEDGYVEWHGLQDLVDGNRDPIFRGARDGEDVTLTIDIDLQRAAEEVLVNPALPGDPDADRTWFERPVGAIVLARVTGEVLAAASIPLEPGGDDPRPWTDGQSEEALERTLLRPEFQPPGSVAKPFIAAYALEHLGLDPTAALVVCEASARKGAEVPERSRQRAGWGAVNCATRWGHSRSLSGRPLALHDALLMSCNAYFAWLGEARFAGPDLAAAYAAFGFGEPTGVRFDATESRYGLRESYQLNDDDPIRPELAAAMPVDVRQRAANGLQHPEATVMQVARAYAALATGTLPEMSLVERIGGTRVPRRGERLGIAEAHLGRIRDALHEVVDRLGGTAHGKGLDAETLGFEVAVKTGSADYKPVEQEHRAALPGDFRKGSFMRKHTWIAGWFPSRDPRYVVVVYNHDTLTTSSHGAVYVAGQFLARPEIRALLAEDAARAAGAAPGRAGGEARPVEAAAPLGEGARVGEPR